MLVSAALFAALSVPAAAEDFHWSKALPAGKTIEIRNLNGAIDAQASSGGDVVVTATKTARRSDPESVRIEVIENAEGAIVCAVYPGSSSRGDTCGGGGNGNHDGRNNDVEVHFKIEVPRGVNFTARAVNGEVNATDLESNVDVETVNGSVRVNTTGEAHAQTVNGSIRADFGHMEGTAPLRFSTVNGGIVLGLPGDASADVRAQTVNGSIETDFPLTVSGKLGPRHVRGRIGSGGRSLELETVNGSIQLRRR